MSTNRASTLWVAAGVLLALVLSAATYLLVISPARTQVASVHSQVDDATLQQNVLRHRLRDLQDIAKDSSGLKAQLAAAKSALPATVDTQGLLRRVQTVSAAASCKVHDVTIAGAVASPVDGVWAVPVSITVDGTADDLVTVLGQLQSDQSRLLTVSDSSLKTGAGAFQLALTVQMYATSAPAAAGGGTAAAGAAASGTAPVSGTTNAS